MAGNGVLIGSISIIIKRKRLVWPTQKDQRKSIILICRISRKRLSEEDLSFVMMVIVPDAAIFGPFESINSHLFLKRNMMANNYFIPGNLSLSNFLLADKPFKKITFYFQFYLNYQNSSSNC